MSAVLYGVGVGPGDPELLTLKAVNIIKQADVILAPKTEKKSGSLALAIATPYLNDGAEIIELTFPMVNNREKLSVAWRNSKETILNLLKQGRRVVFLTLGDPMLYSTFIYVQQMIADSGYPIKVVPGVTSFSAIGSKLNYPLAEGNGILCVVPATVDEKKLDEIISTSDNLVLLKVYKNYHQIVNKLKQFGLFENAILVTECGMEGERVTTKLDKVEVPEVNYLSTIIARRYKANNKTIGKKAILVVSFGTSYPEARKSSIESVENTIKETFQDYEVRRAFTSGFIINKLAERDGLIIDNPEQALQKLKDEGYQQVVVQPLHIIPGIEYEKIKKVVDKFTQEKTFKQLVLGRPLLGSDTNPNDYVNVLKALEGQIPKTEADEAVLMMGHGSEHPANVCYSKMQQEINKTGLNMLIGTVEAEPTLKDIENKLQNKKINKLTLMPFMLVSGDHAQNDLAGDEEDSWRMQLQNDYQVETYLHGLGENQEIHKIYLQHLKDAIAQLNK
ncbi:MAG: precorrin-2 C(20)-methyltransferase [Firmicutes bacterium]|nr:precorrin-2 C(20)-methyltransferase [Bacillota bacterium]